MAEPLFHLAERAHWDDAVRTGSYEISTRGRALADVGFVHCSLRHQVHGVAEALYADVDDLVLLVVDPDRLDVPVRYEPAVPDDEEFPHVYGSLPVSAVVDVRPAGRDAEGRRLLPL